MFYYQIPLHQDVRNFFVARCGEKYFRPTRLPMGFSHSCDIAQSITSTILQRAIGACEFADVYIDGMCVGSDSLHKNEAQHRDLLADVKNAQIELSEDIGPSQLITYRGVEFDLLHSCFRLSEKFVSKFAARIADVNLSLMWGKSWRLTPLSTH